MTSRRRDDHFMLADDEWVRRNDETAIGFARNVGQCPLYILDIPHRGRNRDDTQGRSGRFNRVQIDRPTSGSHVGIEHDRHAPQCRRDFFQQFQPFGGQRALMVADPGYVSPGRAKLATKPLPIGSADAANTMGIVRVSWSSAATSGVLPATITSQGTPTSSLA